MGRALEQRRFEFLPEAAQARRILILGEGDGRFLAELLRANAGAEIDVVDNSAAMLALAEARADTGVRFETGTRRVRFHQADARQWSPPPATTYDLIVTHFFLDCFSEEELEPLILCCARATQAHCRWMVSEFRQPEKGFGAWRARLWIGGLYRLFGWTTGLRTRHLPNYALLLEKHGFRRTRTVIKEMGLLTSELWERATVFTIDAPADAPLHSRTPKS